MSNAAQQAGVTMQNALTGERSFKRIEFAITGDAVSDCMAGIRKVCDDSGLSVRQVQFMMECYANLYKDAADDTDKKLAARRITEEVRSVDSGS